MCHNPERLYVFVPSARVLRVVRGWRCPVAPPAGHGLPVRVAVPGSGGFSPELLGTVGSMQREQLRLAQPFPSLPQVGPLWLPGVCLKRLQQVKGLS